MKYFSILLLLCAACTTPSHEPVLVPEKTTVNIPEALLARCKPLKKIASESLTEPDLVALASAWIDTHDDCTTRQSALVDILKRAFNIKSESSK